MTAALASQPSTDRLRSRTEHATGQSAHEKLVHQLEDYFSNDLLQAIDLFANADVLSQVDRINILRNVEVRVAAALAGMRGRQDPERETWADRTNPSEEPVSFLQRVYARELKQGMTIGDLRHIDFELFVAISSLQAATDARDDQAEVLPRQRFGRGPASARERMETPEQEKARLSRLLSYRKPRDPKARLRR